MIRRQFLALAAAAATLLPFGVRAQASDPENTLIMELRDGRVVIAMRPTRKGFYDGSVFHRVIRGFMAQVGDPTGTGGGGSGQKLRAEFSREAHRRGTVSMARTNDPNSADSQFFICFDDAPHLNGQYTVWGRVVSGMEFVDNIKKGAPGSGAVTDPDRIVRMRVAADVK